MHMALFGSKLTEPCIKVQTHIHIYIQHLANYSKIIMRPKVRILYSVVSVIFFISFFLGGGGDVCGHDNS